MCYLVGVVGAGDQQEDPGEGVLGWIWNLPGFRAWRMVTSYNNCYIKIDINVMSVDLRLEKFAVHF